MTSKKNLVTIGSVALVIGIITTMILKLFPNGRDDILQTDDEEKSLEDSLKENPSKKERKQIKEFIRNLIAQAEKGNEKAKDNLKFIQDFGSKWSKRFTGNNIE